MDSHKFRQLLSNHWPALAPDRTDRLVEYRERVVAGNEIQNLTKLISPEDFYFGHVLDVQKLLEFNKIRFPAVDLGSGCGVPGLLAAIVSDDSWILTDSEGSKARFLDETVKRMGLSGRVRVQGGRLEEWLKAEKSVVESIVARAVGPVERIYNWIRDCSTWNSLVLFKGPGWEDEWKAFLAGNRKKELLLGKTLKYTAGPENKQRILVQIDRVPRGTIKK